MKKILVSVLSFVLAFCLLLTGTGCSQTVYLSFNNAFNDGKDPSSLIETITYDVEYTDNFGDGYIKKDADLTEDLFEFEFTNGKYVSKLETISFLPDFIETDIDTDDTKILKLTGKLTIDFTFTIDGEEKTNNDSIESETYFLLAGASFAPIYSATKSNFSLVSIVEQEVSVSQNEFTSVTEYNQSTYTVTKTAEDEEMINEYEYEYRTAVDNTQLLFTFRSLTITEDQTTKISFVSPAHGEPKELLIKNESVTSTEINASVNGGEKEKETIAVKTLSYYVNETKHAGSAQFVLVQDAESDNLGNRALPLVYAETLTTYGSFMSMGALVYSISDLTIVNN